MRVRWQVTLGCGLALTVLSATPSSAESWPTLEDYVRRCVLIVKCRTEVKDKAVMYRVLETWKGKYSPDLFHHKPAEGYLYTNTWHGNEGPTEGREVIFFFTNSNQPAWTKGKLLHHSTSFVITGGKLVYASTDRGGLRKEYTVEDFKKAVRGAADKDEKQQEGKRLHGDIVRLIRDLAGTDFGYDTSATGWRPDTATNQEALGRFAKWVEKNRK